VQRAEMGQKAGWTGLYGGLRNEKSRKREVNGWASKDTGPNWFWVVLRNRKWFSDFDSRNDIQI
jgi:hypothetical protein